MALKKVNKFLIFVILILIFYLALIIIIEKKDNFELQSKITVQAGTYTNGYIQIKFMNNNFFPVTIYDNKIYAVINNRTSSMFKNRQEKKETPIIVIDTVNVIRDGNILNHKFIIKAHSSTTVKLEMPSGVNLLNCELLYYDFQMFSTLNVFNIFYDKKITKNTKKNRIGVLPIKLQFQPWLQRNQKEEINFENDDDGLHK